MIGKRNAYKILVGNPIGRNSEGIIVNERIMGLKEI
jgi:hypothetical protein